MRTRAGGCCAPDGMCYDPARGGAFCCPTGSRCFNGQCRNQQAYAWLSECEKDKLVGGVAGRGWAGVGWVLAGG
jgi:hypothetical protein